MYYSDTGSLIIEDTIYSQARMWVWLTKGGVSYLSISYCFITSFSIRHSCNNNYLKESHTYCDCDIVAAEPSMVPLDTKDDQSLYY